MKILQINNFHYLRGGSERYYFELSNLLRTRGIEVVTFSMLHEKNVPSEYSSYFVSSIDYEQMAKEINLRNGLKALGRAVYSPEAKKNLISLIEKERPDLVHLHNFHNQLSPSILYAAKKFKLPVVWTVHDYEPLCANTTFSYNNNICEDCRGGKYYNGIKNRCKKGSLAASSLGVLAMYARKIMGCYGLVDCFLTPSNFLRDKLIEYGFDGEKVIHLPNFIDSEKMAPEYSFKGYFLYLGRLSREKGVFTLLEAIKPLKGTKLKLKIAGKGPLEEEIERYIKENELGEMVELLGFQSGAGLEKLIKEAMFLVVPSKWYENFPYSVLEAFAYGKPVIGAQIGGIPEQIDSGINGYTFKMKDSSALNDCIVKLINNPQMIEEMGKNARKKVELQYNTNQHYEKIVTIYDKLIGGTKHE